MKPVPILIALNLLAWIAVALLFVRQGDLESRLASVQAGAVATPAPETIPDEADPADMEAFRKRVRQARELNAREDRLVRFEDHIQGLVTEQRIKPLSPEHRRKVAETLLDTRNAIPEVLRRRGADPNLPPPSPEERLELMRAESERLRAEAQTTLEGFLEPADAQTILEDTFGDPHAQARHP